jgi:DNA repair exonuclease SbcCD ATPase subunit
VLNVVAAIVLATLVIAFVDQQRDMRVNLERSKQATLDAAKKVDVLRDAVKARNMYYQELVTKSGMDIENKNNVIVDLRTQLTGVTGDKTKLQSDLTALNNSYAGLKDSIEKINASKKDLEEKYNIEVAAETKLRQLSDEQMIQIQNLRQEGTDAKARVKSLELQLAEQTKANAYLKQHAQATLPETVPLLPTVSLHGVVKDVDNAKKVAEINLGSSDQVVAGMVFEVSRENKYLGDLKVTKVEENAAVGTLATVQDEIRRDDNVTYTVKH